MENLDVAHHLGAVSRSVKSLVMDGVPAKAVILARNYDTDLEDLWDAMTNPERLPRWFLPVSGDLKLGGTYQLKGNAGGSITECQAPTFLAVTWEMQGQVSWVDVRLEKVDSTRTRFTLTHTAPVSDFWTTYGPGAVGIGWELGLLGMALYIAYPDEPKIDENEFGISPEGQSLIRGSSDGWCLASIADGTPRGEAEAAARRTTAFYTGTEVEPE